LPIIAFDDEHEFGEVELLFENKFEQLDELLVWRIAVDGIGQFEQRLEF
jgi:hypothetical protein